MRHHRASVRCDFSYPFADDGPGTSPVRCVVLLISCLYCMSAVLLREATRKMALSPSPTLKQSMRPAPLALAFLVASGFISPTTAGADDATMAKEILEVAGVKVGLCFHLGAGGPDTPGLTAALAVNSGLLVHGLALDEESLRRAKGGIESRAVYGRAMVERVDRGPLPYLRDFANLTVVENLSALAEHGVTMDEILRVTAPGGVLCVLEEGQWKRTVKARPKEMDEWTHPCHGADGNLVSTDTVFKLPIGFRWLSGLPINLTGFSATRAWVVAGGRCFAVGFNERENIGARAEGGFAQYLSARDAFNGLPLWKIPLGLHDDGAAVNWTNTGPLVASDSRVYTSRRDAVIMVDAASGRIEARCPTKHTARRLLLGGGLLVASCWEKAKRSKWYRWMPESEAGTVEAFDAESGEPRWSLPFCAYQILASDDVVTMLVQSGVLPTEQRVVAADLSSGRELWNVPHAELGGEPDLQLVCAGPGFAVLSSRAANVTMVLSAKDGSELWKVPRAHNLTPVIDGQLWTGGKKANPLTGESGGRMPMWLSGSGCQMAKIVGRYALSSYGIKEMPVGGDKNAARSFSPTGVRPSCVQGYVPANGMLYTAQNNCRCKPGAVYGFAAIGPSGDWPGDAEFEAPRLVERGPAFGTVEARAAGTDDWPTYRHDAERTGCAPSKIPGTLKQIWRTSVVSAVEGPLAEAWKDKLDSCLSAPVVADGKVFVAATDEGRIVALDAATGGTAWSTLLGSRVDSPPTFHEGLCLVGCHDGWVYALRATDGQLVWRTRLAPRERRMVAFGQVESVWPAVGTVLVHEGTAYASAGRTCESDGGIALAALEPATGKAIWSKRIGPGPHRRNDALFIRAGKVRWHFIRLDPANGRVIEPTEMPPLKETYGGGKKAVPRGMLDGTWTRIRGRRGGAFEVDGVTGQLLAWNTKVAVSQKAATLRKTAAPVWKAPSAPGHQIEALALAGDQALFAGRVISGSGSAGFLRCVSLADGKRLCKIPLDSPPTYDGLAVAGGSVYVSLQSGAVVRLGRQVAHGP